MIFLPSGPTSNSAYRKFDHEPRSICLTQNLSDRNRINWKVSLRLCVFLDVILYLTTMNRSAGHLARQVVSRG